MQFYEILLDLKPRWRVVLCAKTHLVFSLLEDIPRSAGYGRNHGYQKAWNHYL